MRQNTLIFLRWSGSWRISFLVDSGSTIRELASVGRFEFSLLTPTAFITQVAVVIVAYDERVAQYPSPPLLPRRLPRARLYSLLECLATSDSRVRLWQSGLAASHARRGRDRRFKRQHVLQRPLRRKRCPVAGNSHASRRQRAQPSRRHSHHRVQTRLASPQSRSSPARAHRDAHRSPSHDPRCQLCKSLLRLHRLAAQDADAAVADRGVGRGEAAAGRGAPSGRCDAHDSWPTLAKVES